MSLDTRAILNAIISHAASLGYFEQVAGHEPKSAPGNGLWASVFLGRVEAVGEVSGLDAATVRVEINVRITQNMLTEPQDDIDPVIAEATDKLLNAYAGNFTLGGLVRNVDVFGETGQGLTAQGGYMEHDHKNYRAVMINLPVIVNDVWELTP
jgi:hypothetical protein